MTTAESRDAGAPQPRFECWLTLWVAACIVAGVALGRVAPAPFHWLAGLEFAHVNLTVGNILNPAPCKMNPSIPDRFHEKTKGTRSGPRFLKRSKQSIW